MSKELARVRRSKKLRAKLQKVQLMRECVFQDLLKI